MSLDYVYEIDKMGSEVRTSIEYSGHQRSGDYVYRQGIVNEELWLGDSPEYTHQYVDIQKPFDWGLAGGLGVYYRHEKVGLFQLEARCNYSFGAVFNNSTIDHFTFANSMNVSLNLAYMWQIKIK